MRNYICVLKQKGEGCDYSIGCGTVAHFFQANDWNDVFQQAKRAYGWDDYEDDDYTVEDIEDHLNSEMALESCVIYEIADKMDTLYETYVDNLIRQKQGIAEDKETQARREQYEALKKEFE